MQLMMIFHVDEFMFFSVDLTYSSNKRSVIKAVILPGSGADDANMKS